MKTMRTLKGFRDFLPGDANRRNFLRGKIQKVFELWGYDPLETPTLEYEELFKGQIGEDEKLFFRFEDTGGRKVALRYDQTVPACRVVGQYANQLPFPFKRYQIQPAFRAENPQKGRYREFLQCDADIWGIPTADADAEVVALSLAIYKELGFKKVIVRVNDRKLLRDYPYEVIVALDKLKKIGTDGVVADMLKKGIPEQKAKEYVEKVKNLKPNDTITTIFKTLQKLGFSKDWYVFDPTIARSFAYSDGPIWEVEIPEYKSGSVLGGERFDSLTLKVSGQDIPGTGFAIGFDRTLEAMEGLGLLPIEKTVSRVLVTVFSPELKDMSLETLSHLRENTVNSEIYLDETASLAKQLKYANQKGIPHVVIIGPDEEASGTVLLKDMRTGTQEKVAATKLAQHLTK